jgi:integrase
MPTLRLTDIVVRGLKGSDKYISYMDETTPGFGIRVGKRSKTFVVIRGRNRERITIGRYPDISLSDARTEAKRLLATAPEGKTVRKTFKEARDAFVTENYKDASPRTKYQVGRLLTRHFKALEAMQLTDIDYEDVKRCLDKLSDRPSEQLHAYRSVRTFFRWCVRPPRRYLKHSPMEGYEAPSKDRKGTRTLSDDELKAIWAACQEPPYSIFRLLILWGTRNTETTLLSPKWNVQEVLTIPGEHTKNGRDHSIPITPLARAVLEALPATGTNYFPGKGGEGAIHFSVLNRLKKVVMERSGTSGWQIRDIRRTFRSNMARLKVPRELCEVLINHAPPVLDEIYDRYDRLDEKRDALAKYEAFLLQLTRSGTT